MCGRARASVHMRVQVSANVESEMQNIRSTIVFVTYEVNALNLNRKVTINSAEASRYTHIYIEY